MLENVESILRDKCKLVKDRPVIVGVSGGPDSLCLMEVLRQAEYPIIVAHFNHQLRSDAEQDARAVDELASSLGLAAVIDGADVRAFAASEKLSIEEAARILRYRFMFKLARERNAQAVAVGHTADDQVETVLMHFLRGSGLAGLTGMSYRSIIRTFDLQIPVVRPLLDARREETVAYCAAHGLHPHHDSTNDSFEFQRNRIRHLLIPNLETYSPNLREVVLRMTQTLESDYDLLMDTLDAAWQDVATDSNEDFIAFDLSLISQRSLGLKRNLIKRAMQFLCSEADVDFSAIERACAFINDPRLAFRMDLKNGLYMFRELDRIFICTADAKLPFDLWPQMPGATPVSVKIPGQVDLAGGWKFICERWQTPASAQEQAKRNDDQFQVWLDADTLPETLELRGRLPGDRFQPLGLDGHSQKLSDFMVNEKMPQRARDRWPLLCSGNVVVWTPGYRPAHPYRLTESTRNVLHFSVRCPSDKDVK